MTRRELTDEDGIDGTFEDAMERARRQDARRIAAYAQRMAKYREIIKAQQGGAR